MNICREADNWNIYFVDRFGAASVSKSYYSSIIKKSSFSFPFLSPLWVVVWGGRGEAKKKIWFFGRYLISNGHFLCSPFQIYQHNLCYLLIIIENNCVKFSYCTLSVALQLCDWMNHCVWGRFLQSWISKVQEIVK